MFVSEEGAVKVEQRHDIRALLRCSQRPRVAQCLHCSGLSGSVFESKFNRALLCCFLLGLTLTVMNVFLSENRLAEPPHAHPYYGSDYRRHQTDALFGYFEIGQTQKALLLMFAAILAVGVLAKKVPGRFCSSAPPPVQTDSGAVLHV